jgi:hypothetical protein
MWHTIVFTATEFSNYFALRDHPDAQGEIAAIARLIRQAYDESEPRKLEDGQWHLPYVDDDEYTDVFDGIRFSAARCAATSYNRQNARNPEKEIERYDQLRSGGHMSPLEHQATPFREDERVLRHVLQLKTSEESRRLLSASHGRERLSTVENEIRRSLEFSGNLRGWRQHRKDVPFEYNFALVREA